MALRIFCTLLLLGGTGASLGSDVDLIAHLIDNLADLGNTDLNLVSDFKIEDQRKVGGTWNFIMI